MENHLFLAHHGIKGMKWGVRRYQNSDGSLTAAGRQRYGKSSGSSTAGNGVVAFRRKDQFDKAFDNLAKSGRPVKKELSKEEIASIGVKSKQTGKIVSGAQSVVQGAQKINDIANQKPRNRYNKRPNLTQEEIDQMSDKDLRDLVNRLNLEQQYSQLTADNVAQSKIETGLNYADAILSIAGGVATVAMAYKLFKG